MWMICLGVVRRALEIGERGLPRPYDGDGDGSADCDIGPVELPEPGAALGLAAGAALLCGLARRRGARR